jgi:hypothetical protein
VGRENRKGDNGRECGKRKEKRGEKESGRGEKEAGGVKV